MSACAPRSWMPWMPKRCISRIDHHGRDAMTIIEVELPDDLAMALAQFLKRVGYSDYLSLA
ncbi:DUF7706 family protein, partial [Massilia frigida]|uniref:DUF7706 family protein n=1 Tax=Massilia frigida TaxID=2609281 RepID=UPI003F8A7415